MSTLALPAQRPAPQTVATLPARLPPAADLAVRTGHLVLDMHVVFHDPELPVTGGLPAALTNVAAAPDPARLRVLGVSLDTVPGDAATGALFAVAVTGLVPVAVPGEELRQAVPGDRLWAAPTPPNEQTFAAGHHGPTYKVTGPAALAEAGWVRIGTVFAASLSEDYCLVLLDL